MADNNIRQVATLGKDALSLLYQQTGKSQYQEAFQTLNAATNGNDLGGALQDLALVAASSGKGAIGRSTGETTSGRTGGVPPLTRDELESLNGQRDADLTSPAVARTPSKRIDNFVNTTDQHPSEWTVQIGGNTLKPDPLLSKNQPVYSGVSEQQVKDFVASITGGAQPSRTFSYKVGTDTVEGQVWNLGDAKVTLRPEAKSTKELGPHWTVEIKTGTVYRGEPGKEKAIEFKFAP